MFPIHVLSATRRARSVAIAILFLATCSPPSESRASSTVAMSLQTMADHAGQVFIGEVVSTRSYWAQNPKRIETEVSFSNVRYLKGRHSAATDTFSLIVPGGSVGQTSMRICCAPEFQIGQRQILFLLPLYKTFPTVGLDQGAFQIIRDAQGIERIFQAANVPVVGFDSNSFALHGGQLPRDVHQQLKDANGAIIRNIEPEAANSSAITLDDFLKVVQPILDASTNHDMQEPAGRRILAELHATTLKTAPGATTTVQPQPATHTESDRDAKDSVQAAQSTKPREVAKPAARSPMKPTQQGGDR